MECVNYNDLGSTFDVFHCDNQGEENIFSPPMLWKSCKKHTLFWYLAGCWSIDSLCKHMDENLDREQCKRHSQIFFCEKLVMNGNKYNMVIACPQQYCRVVKNSRPEISYSLVLVMVPHFILECLCQWMCLCGDRAG